MERCFITTGSHNFYSPVFLFPEEKKNVAVTKVFPFFFVAISDYGMNLFNMK